MLRALILAGGESRRMGRNKALLRYFGQPQVWHLYRMISGLIPETYVSCREDQAELYEGLPLIKDLPEYAGHGPVSGLLSAVQQLPGDWLLVGCDYPLLGEPHLQALLDADQPDIAAVAWKSPESGRPEPLLTLYKAGCFPGLTTAFNSGNDSLSHYLQSIPTVMLDPGNGHFLRSADTPDDYENILDSLGG